MIWAEANGGVIGRSGDMPWHLPEDLKHFQRTTLGAPVIMGRRTWESLPARVRPLPGRTNLVVSRKPDTLAPGATVVPSLEAALALLAPAAHEREPGATPAVDAWVMGGGELYRAALPLADELVVTRISLDVSDADTFAPQIGPEWTRVAAEAPAVGASGLGFRIERWVRAAPAKAPSGS